MEASCHTLPHLYVRADARIEFALYYCSENTGHIVMMMSHYYDSNDDINDHTGVLKFDRICGLHFNYK